MILNGKKVDFPAVCKISFYKVIEQLEIQAKDNDENVAVFAKNLLKEVEQYPLIKDGFDDIGLIEEYRPIIDKLSRTLFPDSLSHSKRLNPCHLFKEWTRHRSRHPQRSEETTFHYFSPR